jgi:hypothetical protein
MQPGPPLKTPTMGQVLQGVLRIAIKSATVTKRGKKEDAIEPNSIRLGRDMEIAR